MAIDLVAKLRLQDDFSAPMQRATKNMDRAAKKTEALSNSMKKVDSTFRDAQGRLRNANGQFVKMNGGLSGLTGRFKGLAGGLVGVASRLNPVAMGLTAIGTAAAGAYASVKLFNATVGEAAKMQQSEVVIGAMFNDKDLTKQYTQLLDRYATDSPLFDSQAMFANSKSFITTSKDIGQLEKMWSLTERLMASDPRQGIDGAVLALKELFSGDAISIVERFELPRSVMNDIKNLPLEQQLSRLDEYFNKIGLTTHLIDEMGGTAIGMWTQVKERFALVLRQMGEPSLKAVSTFLTNVLNRLDGPEVQKFAQWGGEVINQMVSGLSNNALKIYDYFTQLTASPEFQQKTTLTGKINFIVEDIADRLQAWYDGGGKDKIIAFGSEVAQVLVSAMDATDEVFALGSKLGTSIWQGVIAGVKASAAESPIGKIINGYYEYGPMNLIKKGIDNAKNSPIIKGLQQNDSSLDFGGSSRYNGIDYVPHDGYKISAHRGEKLLTAEEAKQYKKGNGANGISITGNTFHVRQESDIKKVAYELAKLLESEALQIG